MQKSFDIKKFLSNNAIIILICILAVFTGAVTKNFFTVNNFKNLVVNVSPRFIIACGVSGCLITKGTRPVSGPCSGSGSMYFCYDAAEHGLCGTYVPVDA